MTLILPGDQNDNVRQLQLALNTSLAICLNPNGIANPDTINAVRTFQSQHGLTVDGIAGDATLNALGLTLVHLPISMADYQNAANVLNLTVAHVRAVGDVETVGAGFLLDGRAKILFERHQFYKRMIIPRKPGETVAGLTAQRAVFAAANPDICNPVPGGYQGGPAEWDRLARARVFSDTAGLESASFGMFQVMGFNAVSSGYPSVQVFVRAMAGSGGDQLMAFIGFLKANANLISALQTQNWAAFAAGYNGPGYAANHYDTKMAAAFAKYSST